MNGKQFKLISIVLVIFIVISLFAGCVAQPNSEVSQPSKTDVPIELAPYESNNYPIKTDVVLTLWGVPYANQSAVFDNTADTEWYKEVEKRTGIKVEFVHPQNREALSVMMATGDLPDMLSNQWHRYPGNVQRLFADGLIVNLNDVKEYAPNYFNFLSDNYEQVGRYLESDKGEIFGFTSIEAKEGLSDWGPVIRKDWLDDLGLNVPETIDEWYITLTEFKNKKNATAPLVGGIPDDAFIIGAYGIKNSLMVDDDGKIIYGPMQPSYKGYLSTLAKWYAEGLIDKDFASLQSQLRNSKLIQGEAGADVRYAGVLNSINSVGLENDPKYNLVAAPWPTLNKGERPKIGVSYWQVSTSDETIVLTVQSKNKELAARWCDYSYSDEGIILANFGVEGKSYTINSQGIYRYTDELYNSPNGWSLFQEKAKWTRSNASGAYIRHEMLNLANAPEKFLNHYIDAYNIWSDTGVMKHNLLPVSIPADKGAEANTILNEVKTYVDEMLYKFIFGDISIDDTNFNQYVSHVGKMKIDKVLDVHQETYDSVIKKTK